MLSLINIFSFHFSHLLLATSSECAVVPDAIVSILLKYLRPISAFSEFCVCPMKQFPTDDRLLSAEGLVPTEKYIKYSENKIIIWPLKCKCAFLCFKSALINFRAKNLHLGEVAEGGSAVVVDTVPCEFAGIL